MHTPAAGGRIDSLLLSSNVARAVSEVGILWGEAMAISWALCPITTLHKTRKKHPSPHGGAKGPTAHALLSSRKRAAVHVLLGRQEEPT
jgi:hypothetical protein